ncbi:hypothetical protein CYK57_01384 [Actinobacillus pleuropneumoniae]|nr:hypothetical protein appser10_12500 [Actinobacillus pleuropneumoniae serovar 10 str. D13039]QSZ39243.1 hypothetical protein CYK57_01384 [Actinobacillus pleuropneumoniae]
MIKQNSLPFCILYTYLKTSGGKLPKNLLPLPFILLAN